MVANAYYVLALVTLVCLALLAKGRHSERQAFARIISEKRTQSLLIFPFIACITTILMTRADYDRNEIPLNHRRYLLSDGVNYHGQEDWAAWMARWTFWHLVVFYVVEFKLQLLPWDMMWVPLLWGSCLLVGIWCGMHQYEKEAYTTPGLGLPPLVRENVHVFCGSLVSLISYWESSTLWWPSRRVHTFFSFVILAMLTSYLFVNFAENYITNAIFGVMEFLVVFLHLAIVWHKAPEVECAMAGGSYRPWVSMCGWCCPQFKLAGGKIYRFMPPPGASISDKPLDSLLGDSIKVGDLEKCSK